ncbi:MAG: thioredoxin-dependent thiol peroxidase [Ignavibacteriota bacterium]|nr:MAG: thioredoxin-dependent thiol peroxidase [Chlorobiota bacterium]MBE7478263.1 thioredoxin-dependent thiol peroxidase [Ignavibacteriales bacterium]MBL1121507.1 thioredoxin-dependent thiol peroxidase [Ignavibacteriota bacterium]MCC7094073.1 thioredoxin-dependent thiol peroxidase [Ignavibacteriaceae bacterium]MCE7855769.1 thioredoxin-dependent thiol peroxidase [Ignavibacteria bacterium CHB3]MEB2295404.1 thioredoxin-dependent thiol peroxidase [Ignavibacteria bacterium]
MALKVGDKAPAFKLKNQDEETISLSGLKGKPVVLYFYPKDDTPGCTKEACNFRDEFPKFGKLKAEIIGISTDSVKSHKKFAEKYGLPFILLADEKKQVVQEYGVWKEKNMYGRKYLGIERTTFIINSDGRIANIFPKVKVDEHNKEVMEALKEL